MSNTIRDLELKISEAHKALAVKELADARAKLRDELAMTALAGVLSTAGGQDLTHEERAAWCYREADAMLEARNANP